MKTIIFLLTTLFTSIAMAASSGAPGLTVGPIIGLERVHRYYPEERSVSRVTYGLRLVYGTRLLSIEAQATQAKNDESLPRYNYKYEETATTGMLGLKSTFAVLQSLDWYLRAGGHGSKREVTQTENGVTTTSNPGVKVSPYVGTGVNINLFDKVRLDAGLTVVFPKESGQKSDYLGTLGFSIHI